YKTGIRNYLGKYQFRNVTIPDFLNEMEGASGKDLSDFKRVWLDGTLFPETQVRQKLMDASPGIASLYKLHQEMTASSGNNEAIIRQYWDGTSSNLLKGRILERYYKALSTDFLKQAFASNDIKIRQALVLAVDKIP